MSLSCSKQFKITVPGLPEPEVYYDFESIASGVTDVTGNGNSMPHITHNAGTGVLIPGIIGNGLANNSAPQSDFWQADPLVPIPLVFNDITTDATARFWFRILDASYLPFFGVSNVSLNTNFFIQAGSTGVGIGLQCQFGTKSNFIAATVDANWHRLISTWDHTTQQIGMQLDNGPMTLGASATGGDFSRVLLNAGWCVDEFAFWKTKLSAAQILFDWNNGAGRTYPFTP